MPDETERQQRIEGDTNAQAKDHSNANVNKNENKPNFVNNFALHITSEGRSTGQPAEASQPAPERALYVSIALTSYFTGREETLAQLHDNFTRRQVYAQALSGIGGVGKTQTARKYVEQYQNEYEAVIWLTADVQSNLESDLVKVAQQLELPEKDIAEQIVVTNAVRRWFKSHTSWLLVLDNAEPEEAPEILKEIRGFIALASQHRHILITTRTPSLGSLARTLELRPFSSEEGVRLLLRRVDNLETENLEELRAHPDYAQARKITEDMGGLALALTQAGAYVEENGCSLDSYLELFEQQRAELLAYNSLYSTEEIQPVDAVWSLSFERVKERDPLAAKLLQLFAFLQPDAIPEDLPTLASPLTGDTYTTTASQARTTLYRHALISRASSTQTFSIHRLVQDVLKQNMDEESQRRQAELAINVIQQGFAHTDFAHWPQCQRYQPHAQLCLEYIKHWHVQTSEAATLINNLGQYHSERGSYRLAEPLLSQALELRTQIFGANDLTVAETRNNLSEVLRKLGKFKEALPICQQALNIREQSLGREHLETATSYNNLARLHHELGIYGRAEALYKQAFAIRQKLLVAPHAQIAESLNDLAALYNVIGNYKKAFELHQQAFDIRKQIFSDSHPDIALSLGHLASTYHALGDFHKALELTQQSLNLRKRLFGDFHPLVALSLNGLAETYRALGDFHKALDLQQQALDLQKQLFGDFHPNVALSLNSLAEIYRALRDFHKALDLQQQALDLQKQLFGDSHPTIAFLLNNLANNNAVLNKPAEALDLYQQALVHYRQVFSDNHPSIATTLQGLASLQQRQGQYPSAKKNLEQAMHIYEEKLGLKHPDTAEVSWQLAELHKISSGNLTQEGKWYEKALVYYRTLDEDNKERLQFMKDYIAVKSKMPARAKRKGKGKK